jgi:CPA2 family monovalent cation:H+ antiporter-2
LICTGLHTQLEETMSGHVVIVGYGRVGHHIVSLLGEMGIPHLVVDADAERVDELDRLGIPSLFGDAANSEVLTHAGLERARALVVAGPDEDASALVVASARDLAPALPIIARTSTEDGARRLSDLGAQNVIHPELEGGLEIVRHTLLQLGFPPQEINRYTDAVRSDHYDLPINTEEEHRLLRDLLEAESGIEIRWFRLPDASPLLGRTLADANLRARTGASVVAILRHGELSPNPSPARFSSPATGRLHRRRTGDAPWSASQHQLKVTMKTTIRLMTWLRFSRSICSAGCHFPGGTSSSCSLCPT